MYACGAVRTPEPQLPRSLCTFLLRDFVLGVEATLPPSSRPCRTMHEGVMAWHGRVGRSSWGDWGWGIKPSQQGIKPWEGSRAPSHYQCGRGQ